LAGGAADTSHGRRYDGRHVLASVVRTPGIASRGGQHDALLERRVIVLRGMIDDTAANHVIAKLLYLRDQNNTAPIRLHIDSSEGGVLASLAIRDIMHEPGPAVHTHCLSKAHGTAVVVLAHGARGHRTAATHARLSLCPINAAARPDSASALEQVLVAML